jgi:hypothetical protein
VVRDKTSPELPSSELGMRSPPEGGLGRVVNPCGTTVSPRLGLERVAVVRLAYGGLG